LEEDFDIIGEAHELADSLRLKAPLVADWRIEPPLGPDEIPTTSARVLREGGFGMTIFAIGYPPSFIRTCASQSQAKVFPVIDLGRKDVMQYFPDRAVMTLARASRKFGCPWVIMSARNASRIRTVSEAKISGLSILAYLEPGTQRGVGLASGADFEITPLAKFEGEA